METKQTAVKFLWQWIMKNPLGSFDDGINAYNKAKEIEQEQIEEAYNTTYGFIDGREYYEKTYGIHSKK